MSNEIILYDLPSSGKCQCWSPNTWKSIVLNFKGIPYKTEFVPFHKLQETIKATGVEKNEPGAAFIDYTVPTIILPDGIPIMESLKIAQKLEELHPTPSLHLDSGMHLKVSGAISATAGPLLPVFMPIIGRSVVHESDSEWFETDRSKRFGMPLAEFEKEKGGEQAWKAAKPGMETMRELLTDNKTTEGPFIMGSVPCYGDLVLLSFMKFFRRTGMYEKWVENYGGPEMDALWEAGKGWVERAD